MWILSISALFAASCLISSESEDLRRLLEERDLLREQVKSLRDEIKLHSSSSGASCDYLEDRVDDLARASKAKNDEMDKLREEIAKVRAETASSSQCKTETKRNEKYGEENQIRFKGKYHFPVEPMKRIQFKDPDLMKNILDGLPVVIVGSNLTSPALRWNLNFLARELKTQNVRIFVSPNRQFRYHSAKFETDAKFYKWTPPYEIREGTFQYFVEIVNELKRTDNGSRAYFQFLLNELNLTEAMEDDFNGFNWNWIHDKILPAAKWGKLKHNLLLVGMPDVSTPVHYDGMENLFSMIYGHKRCILFDPSQFKGLYPFPNHHPHDRQSQVDFDNPNFEMFPRFREVHGYEAILGPGEVLYIPSHWWHYIESERDSMTVSLNFWFYPAWEGKEGEENREDQKKLLPVAVDELLVKREVETMIAESFHPTKVKDVLKEILDRRFEFIDAKPVFEENNFDSEQ